MRLLRSQIALLVPALLLATACQGGEPEEPKEEPSPSPVAAADLEKVEPPEDPEELADLVQERMEKALSVKVAMSVVPEEEEGEASIEDVEVSMLLTDPPAAKMTVVDNSEERPSTAHIIVTDKTMYTTLEEEALLPDKDWMRLTQEEIDSAEEEIGPFAEVFRVMLTETNKSLEQASGRAGLDVVRYGELEGDPEQAESEDGGPLTVYTGTTPTRDLADAGHADFKAAADAGLKEVSWEFSVTDRGLPEEFSVEMATPDGQEARSTVHYSEWGSDIEISAPAEDNVGTIMESLNA
ncbi:hypothetical protein [Nocardiopsis potens]|uniref:hypothetical protein n=1 Tax=Nocardiopsis potens TaxID=1246458 RepID=UPI000345B1A7|nr:hypothetical protein [Nocardiopsis potens]